MIKRVSHLILAVAFLAAASVLVHAQGADASTRSGVPQKEDLPKGIKESLAKSRIEQEKKDFAELLERGEEAVKLSNELETSFIQNNQISTEDRKRLDRLEKLVKKIREGIGGKDDGNGDGNDDETVQAAEKPSTMLDALKSLQSTSLKLVDELKKTTRYSVSVVAVESSNLLLKVVKFLRFGKN